MNQNFSIENDAIIAEPVVSNQIKASAAAEVPNQINASAAPEVPNQINASAAVEAPNQINASVAAPIVEKSETTSLVCQNNSGNLLQANIVSDPNSVLNNEFKLENPNSSEARQEHLS